MQNGQMMSDDGIFAWIYVDGDNGGYASGDIIMEDNGGLVRWEKNKKHL